MKLYCETSRLSDLRAFLSRELEGAAFDEIQKHQIILAVEEVCANLMIHTHKCDPKRSIELHVTENEDKMIFEITDRGKAFNILEYDIPDLKKVKKEKRKGGLGIMLVKKIMDKIEFETHNQVNVCRLIKHYRSK